MTQQSTRHIPEETETEKKKHVPPMSIAALFIIVKVWMQPRCPLTDKRTKKLWYMNIMEYYSAIKYSAFESVLMR